MAGKRHSACTPHSANVGTPYSANVGKQRNANVGKPNTANVGKPHTANVGEPHNASARKPPKTAMLGSLSEPKPADAMGGRNTAPLRFFGPSIGRSRSENAVSASPKTGMLTAGSDAIRLSSRARRIAGENPTNGRRMRRPLLRRNQTRRLPAAGLGAVGGVDARSLLL